MAEEITDKVRREYYKAVDFIKGMTGLELTLIEKVELKHLVEWTVRVNEATKDLWNDFSPNLEAAIKFLYDNYGFPVFSPLSEYEIEYYRMHPENLFPRNLIAAEMLMYEKDRKMIKERTGFDWYAEYWKLRQEEMHMP